MCDKRNSVRTYICGQRKWVRVDACLRNFITYFSTFENVVACCCGHGKYHMTIVVKFGKGYGEIFSGVDIPRTRRFYKKDSRGFYFIPEVEQYWKEKGF